MNEREELEALRRLAELEAKASSPAAKQAKGASGTWQDPKSATWQQDPVSGFRRGFVDDPMAGLKQLAAETELADLVAPQWVRRTKQQLAQQEAEYQAARGDQGIDWARLGGQIINPVNLGIAALTKTPPGASLPVRMSAGAVGGGAMGSLSPVYGDSSRGGQTVSGLLGGAAAAPLTAGLARVVKPKVDPNVSLLRQENITPTVGRNMGNMAQSVEDRLSSLPLLGDAINYGARQSLDDLNRAIYNRALSPVGIKHSGKLGEAGVAEVRQTLSNKYQAALNGLSLRPDQQFTAELTALHQTVNGMMPAERNIWSNLLAKLNNRTKTGTIDHDTLKSIHTTMDDVTDKLRRDGSYEKTELADVLDDLRTALNEAVKRNNPQRAAALNKLDEAWANYAILRDAAFQATKRKGSGLVTPSDLQAAVTRGAQRSSSKAAAMGKVTEGKALMQDLSDAALRVLPSNYPDSGTAGRLLMGGGVLAGAANPASAVYATPYALGAGLGSLPYMPGGRQAASWLLSGRQGPLSDMLANTIRSNPALLAPAAPMLLDR